MRNQIRLPKPARNLVEFLERFGVRFDTVRSWEEGNADSEDPAALALLRVIEREPEAVARVFAQRDVA